MWMKVRLQSCRPMAQVRHDQKKKKNKKILSLGVEKGRTSRLEKL